eukprot:1139807-Pelagomonas_calceolata.AAC.3
MSPLAGHAACVLEAPATYSLAFPSKTSFLGCPHIWSISDALGRVEAGHASPAGPSLGCPAASPGQFHRCALERWLPPPLDLAFPLRVSSLFKHVCSIPRSIND